ncbi:MAG: 4'-phosphopantetheinyl transferase superfamily protein [Bacilli bacterium]|jgi:holo-[acyl-carrier protein] synthase|nr:4'-phosphopantetheinyl transferase superfamily protein [Bacilli bacterium]
MIVGIGVDIIEQSRFVSFLEDDRKLKKILSSLEIACIKGFHSTARKLEYVASRFAAKEALYKAGLRFVFSKVSILSQENQPPLIIGLEDKKVHLSISHNQTMSIAYVIVEQ